MNFKLINKTEGQYVMIAASMSMNGESAYSAYRALGKSCNGFGGARSSCYFCARLNHYNSFPEHCKYHSLTLKSKNSIV